MAEGEEIRSFSARVINLQAQQEQVLKFYFSDRLTFPNIRYRTSRRIY